MLILEPDSAGHHLLYVSTIARHAQANYWTVELATGAPQGSSFLSWQENIASLVTNNATWKPLSQNRRAVFLAVFRALRREDIDRVVIPDVDRWLLAVAAATLFCSRRAALRLLIMRPTQQEKRVLAQLRFRIKLLCARIIASATGAGTLAILDVPRVGDWVSSWPRGTQALFDCNLVPPSQVSVSQARARYGLSDEAVVLALLGVLSRRKNPDIAMEAARLVAEATGREVVLLCVGPVEDDSSELLGTAENVRVVHRPLFVSEIALSEAITAADVVLCLYSNEGSSGIVTAAAAHGTPVVAAGAGGVKAMVTSLTAGSVAEMDPLSIARAVQAELSRGRRKAQKVVTQSDTRSIAAWAIG